MSKKKFDMFLQTRAGVKLDPDELYVVWHWIESLLAAQRESLVGEIENEDTYELCNDDCNGAEAFKSNLINSLKTKGEDE